MIANSSGFYATTFPQRSNFHRGILDARGHGPPKVTTLAKSYVPEGSMDCGNFKPALPSSLFLLCSSSHLGATAPKAIPDFSRASLLPSSVIVHDRFSIHSVVDPTRWPLKLHDARKARVLAEAQYRSPIYVRYDNAR